jgi:hypothetical protein
MGMADEYRRYATACLELARVFEHAETRALLLHMAQVWFRLAEKWASAPPNAAENEIGDFKP